MDKNETEKEYDVVALGELLVDMAEGKPSDTGNMTFEACPGGAPCNVLAMLQKAGHKTAFIGKVGDDFLGRMLKNTIESVGIDSVGLLMDENVKTTLAFVHKKEDGDRDFSFYRKPGADMMLKEEEVDENLIKASRIFHFGTLSMTAEGVRRATEKAVEIARSNAVLVSFDPNLREPLWDSLCDAKEAMLWGMNHCDILKISDNEVEFVTGEKDTYKGFELLKKITSAKVIFMTLGKDGSLGWAQSMKETASPVYAAGVKQETIVDTTGAGDTFFGCGIHFILEHGMELSEEEMSELLSYANDRASRITQVKGALKAMPEA